MFCPASDFFQYFNPSSVCLQTVDRMESFLPKLLLGLEAIHPLMGCSNCSDGVLLKPKFEAYRWQAV